MPPDAATPVPLALSTDVMVRVRPATAFDVTAAEAAAAAAAPPAADDDGVGVLVRRGSGSGRAYRWSAPVTLGRMREAVRMSCARDADGSGGGGGGGDGDEDGDGSGRTTPTDHQPRFSHAAATGIDGELPWDVGWFEGEPPTRAAFDRRFHCCALLEEAAAAGGGGGGGGGGGAGGGEVRGSRGSGGVRLLTPCDLCFSPPLVIESALLCDCRVELRNEAAAAPRAAAPDGAGGERWRGVLGRGACCTGTALISHSLV